MTELAKLRAALATSSGWGYYEARDAEEKALNAPEKVATRTPSEVKAREAGWFLTRHAHVMFKAGSGVCRHLKEGEVYQPDTDSLMSSPLRHADSWDEACKMDGLK